MISTLKGAPQTIIRSLHGGSEVVRSSSSAFSVPAEEPRAAETPNHRAKQHAALRSG